ARPARHPAATGVSSGAAGRRSLSAAAGRSLDSAAAGTRQRPGSAASGSSAVPSTGGRSPAPGPSRAAPIAALHSTHRGAGTVEPEGAGAGRRSLAGFGLGFPFVLVFDK